jgi:hypothetical protein
VDPSASHEIQFGINMEANVIAVAADSPVSDLATVKGEGRLTSQEGYERRGVNNRSCHLLVLLHFCC